MDPVRLPTRRVMISIQEAAEVEGVHPNTIRRRVAAGELPVYRFGRSRVLRVDRDEVAALYQREPTDAGTTPA